MAEEIKARIGFVSGGAGSMPHYNSFLPIVPKEIEIDFQGLELYGKSLYEIADKKEIIVRRVSEFVANRGWNGVIVTAAPTVFLIVMRFHSRTTLFPYTSLFRSLPLHRILVDAAQQA